MPRGGNFNQLLGHNAHPAFDAGNPCLPGSATKPVKLAVAVTAAIAAQKFDIFNRQIQFITTRIDKMQTIMVAAGAVDNDKTVITADTMFGMHH